MGHDAAVDALEGLHFGQDTAMGQGGNLAPGEGWLPDLPKPQDLAGWHCLPLSSVPSQVWALKASQAKLCALGLETLKAEPLL